jgi:hypothetical protein
VRRAVVLVLALCACGLGVAACGGGKSSGQRTTPPGRNVDPTPAEGVDSAIARVEGAVTASGCDAVKGLLHSSYGTVSDVACRAVKAQLDGFRNPEAKRYGAGAVIDYTTFTGAHRAVLLALDADRTFRVDFVVDVPDATIGTARPAGFDRAAGEVVRAMQAGNCDAFLRLVDRAEGLGVGPDREVCARVSNVPFRRELVANPQARPVPLGGNSQLAFYKLRTSPDAYYTMVMRQVTDRAGLTRYVLVNALPAQ